MVTDVNEILLSPAIKSEQEAEPIVALMSCGDLFEDFFDTIGVSFEKLRIEQTGGWMFNYVDALNLVNVKTCLIFVSAKVSETLRFSHQPTGAMICILPAPKLHRLYRNVMRILRLPKKSIINSFYSYLVLPTKILKKELQLQNCSAILFQDYENSSFDVCVRIGLSLDLPTFATFQGGGRPRSRMEYGIRSITLNQCAGVIIGSQKEIERVQQQYKISKSKIGYIFNPLDIHKWIPFDRKQSRMELGLPSDSQVVVSHGRIDISHKGLDVLLSAWQQVCQNRPNQNLQLLLVGSGRDTERFQQMIQATKLSNIIWINEYLQDRTLICKYLSASDIYVLASRFEGFPVAPVEAMSCGLPVVMTDVPGAADILTGGECSGGIVVPKEDPEALASALQRLLDDPTLRESLGQAASHRAHQNFSLESIGKQMRNFILHSS